jgi:hypothetical protein
MQPAAFWSDQVKTRFESTGTHRGYEYKVLVHPFGHRCGYVRIPDGHPWHGKSYDELCHVDVHGGLTFSEQCGPDHPLGEGYWIGFDCGHCFDAPEPDEMSKDVLGTRTASLLLGNYKPPVIKALEQMMREAMGLGEFDAVPMPKGKIRGRAYVESQCKNLAAAVAEAVEDQG